LFAKLDKLILRTFIGPFIATFFIALFVVVIQFFWKYIDEMVGKGIDFGTLLKMIGIVSLQSGVVFALPIAVLLASLMTFGNLAESFELVAIKSSGISLLRFMRPLFIFVLFICGLAFLFNNYIIPKANLKFFTLLSDIRLSKPGFDIKPGTFYTELNGYAIYVNSKDDKTGELKDIVIYENSNNSYQDNFLVAEKGKIKVSGDKKGLEFTLYNGERTQERGKSLDANTDFIRVQFKEYKKNFDISDLLLKQTADSTNKTFYKALDLTQLNDNIDSLQKTPKLFAEKTKPSLAVGLVFLTYLKDSAWKDEKVVLPKNIKSFIQLLPDSVQGQLGNTVAEKFSAAKNQLDIDLYDYKNKMDSLRFHNIEWHRKFTFSIICIVMFLIGAPLGAIVRRGGLGTPLLLAIVFFVIYFILFTIGEKSANTNSVSPLTGMWLPVYVMLPFGLYLVYVALFKKIKTVFQKKTNVAA
jgi:lipopolysaccharide export system permease protein